MKVVGRFARGEKVLPYIAASFDNLYWTDNHHAAVRRMLGAFEAVYYSNANQMTNALAAVYVELLMTLNFINIFMCGEMNRTLEEIRGLMGVAFLCYSLGSTDVRGLQSSTASVILRKDSLAEDFKEEENVNYERVPGLLNSVGVRNLKVRNSNFLYFDVLSKLF